MPTTQTTSPTTPIVGVFRRGGLHFGRLTALNRDLTALNLDLTAPNRDFTIPNLDLTAAKRGELRCERRAVELGPRRGRHQTGGIAPIEARHAGDTPKQGS